MWVATVGRGGGRRALTLSSTSNGSAHRAAITAYGNLISQPCAVFVCERPDGWVRFGIGRTSEGTVIVLLVGRSQRGRE